MHPTLEALKMQKVSDDMYQSLIAIIAVNDGGLYMSYKIAHFMIAITSVNNRRICNRKLF